MQLKLYESSLKEQRGKSQRRIRSKIVIAEQPETQMEAVRT